MFLNKIRNIFVSATNVARAGKRGNICVGNNVSATMCPRLLGPLYMIYLTKCFKMISEQHSSKNLAKIKLPENPGGMLLI